MDEESDRRLFEEAVLEFLREFSLETMAKFEGLPLSLATDIKSAMSEGIANFIKANNLQDEYPDLRVFQCAKEAGIFHITTSIPEDGCGLG